MLLSQTSAYAVRAVIHLAECGESAPVPAAELAEALAVPRNYLGKILLALARAGVLASERGPRGGFRLAAAPSELSLLEVAGAVAPVVVDRRCLLGRAECTDADPCRAHHQWQGLADRITAFLEETSVADLMRRPPLRLRRTGTRAARPRRRSRGGAASTSRR